MDGPISTNEAAGSLQQAASISFRSPSVGPPEKVPPVLEGERSRSSGQDETGQSDKMSRSRAGQEQRAEAERAAMKQQPAFFVEFGAREAEHAEEKSRLETSRELPPPPLEREAEEREEALSADELSSGPLTDQKSLFEAGADQGREALSLPGDPSSPSPTEVLSDALANAKARWAEVNQEALESGTLPGQGDPIWAEGMEVTEDLSAQTLSDTSGKAEAAENKNITEAGQASSQAEVGFSAGTQGQAAPTGEISMGAGPENGLQRQLTSRYESVSTSLSSPQPNRPIIDLFV